MSETKVKEEKFLDKFIELNLLYSLENSKLRIEYLENKIHFYQKKRHSLENNKPFNFQRKKLCEYTKKQEEYSQIIYQCYQEISKEIDVIIKLKNELEN